MVTPRSKMQTKPTRLPSKKNVKKSVCAIIRRSGRLRNVTPPAQKQEIEPVVQEINLCESEKEDEPHVEENPLESMSPEQSLEEEGDYSKGAKIHFQNDRPKADLKYKRLYFDSQKKIEALTKEKYDLSKDLEVALAKVEANKEVVRDLVGQFKDMVLIPNMGKATETAMNLSSQAVPCRCSSPSDIGDRKAAVKRKKNDIGDPKAAVKRKKNDIGDPKAAVKREKNDKAAVKRKKNDIGDRKAAVKAAVKREKNDKAAVKRKKNDIGDPKAAIKAAVKREKNDKAAVKATVKRKKNDR